jgi:hypothetical protein
MSKPNLCVSLKEEQQRRKNNCCCSFNLAAFWALPHDPVFFSSKAVDV